jgi:DNA-binding FrmR family transcriptional regulator
MWGILFDKNLYLVHYTGVGCYLYFMSILNNDASLKKIQVSAKKAVGAINKSLSLLEDPNYPQCSDVLVQIDSAIGSLNSARSQILDHFIDNCLDENITQGDKTKLKQQLIKLYKLTK